MEALLAAEEGTAAAAEVDEAEAQRAERERRRLERKEELEEGFSAGSDANKTCNKDRPGRESSRKRLVKQPTHTDEERRASWGHAKSKLRGLKSVGGDMSLPENIAARRLPSMRARRPRGAAGSSTSPQPAAAGGSAAAAGQDETAAPSRPKPPPVRV